MYFLTPTVHHLLSQHGAAKERWTTNLVTLNIKHHITEQYATIFYAKQITEAVLETTDAVLQQLGIKDFVDTKSILHHAQSTITNPRTSITTPPLPDTTYNNSVTTFMKPPLAKPPIILANKYDATPISQILH